MLLNQQKKGYFPSQLNFLIDRIELIPSNKLGLMISDDGSLAYKGAYRHI
jgi:hypothetical protein